MSECDVDIDNLLVRVHRVRGQINAIEAMLNDEAHCNDVLMQLSAATAALRSIAVIVARKQIETCVKDAVNANDEKSTDEKISEISLVVDRLLRYEKS